MTEDDHGALECGQFVQRAFDMGLLLARNQIISLFSFDAGGCLHTHMPMLFVSLKSSPRQRKVYHDAVQPRAEFCIAPKGRKRMIHFHERLLRYVLSALMVADKMVRNVVRLLAVTMDEKAKRFRVPFLGPLDKKTLAFHVPTSRLRSKRHRIRQSRLAGSRHILSGLVSDH